MVKKCNKCLNVKPVSDFSKESRAKNGYKPRCKKCTAEYTKQWLKQKPDYISKQSKKYYANNPDLYKQRVKEYSIKNRDKKIEYNKSYRLKNLDSLRLKQKEYLNNRISTDENFRAKRLFRRILKRLVQEKKGRTADLLGYTINDLISCLGRMPNKNETVDHKVPITWFLDFSYVKEINSLHNLQILSRSENCKKSNTFAHPVSDEYYNQIINLIKPQYKQKIKRHGD